MLTNIEQRLTFTTKEKSEYTGDSIERWSDESDEYYDSYKILHRLLITAFLDGNPVGYATLEYTTYTEDDGSDGIIDDENDTDEAYLERIDVDNDYQGKGIGTALLKYCLEKVHNLNLASSIVLSPDNKRAKQWYTKIGSEIYDNYWSNIDQGYGVYRIRKFDLD